MTKWADILAYDESSPTCLRRLCGKVAGYIRPDGYCRVKAGGCYAYSHRIVWQLHNGEIPEGCVIDHKDKNPRNNKIGNLRLLPDNGENQRNSKKSKLNTSGKAGVSLVTVTCKRTQKQYTYWKAGWVDLEGRTYSKYFSISKLGSDSAFILASEYRDTMILKLNEQGAGYYEDHGQL